jgi:hypothetical protein
VEKNTAYAYLSIDEFACSVEELTKRVGLQPTEAWNAGEIIPPVRFPRKFSAWRIKTRLRHLEEVERHVIDVLDQIRGHEAVLRDIARDYRIRMQCVGYYNEHNPGFSSDADTVRRVAECGMTLDLDSYHFYTENQEAEVEHESNQ